MSALAERERTLKGTGLCVNPVVTVVMAVPALNTLFLGCLVDILLVFDSTFVLGMPRPLGPPSDRRAFSGHGTGGPAAIWVVKPVWREAWEYH